MEEAEQTASVEVSPRIKELAKSGIHLGYSRSSRHPMMNPYLFGIRNSVAVFDIAAMEEQLEKAKAYVRSLGAEKKCVLFVGTKREAQGAITRAADELGMPRVTVRWIGGTLTNFKQIRARIEELIRLRAERESGELKKYTKKEQIRIAESVKRLEHFFSGVELLTERPAAVVVIDPKHERGAVREANAAGVAVIALANSDVDPRGVEYLVPGNDGSRSSIALFLGELAAAYRGE